MAMYLIITWYNSVHVILHRYDFDQTWLDYKVLLEGQVRQCMDKEQEAAGRIQITVGGDSLFSHICLYTKHTYWNVILCDENKYEYCKSILILQLWI